MPLCVPLQTSFSADSPTAPGTTSAVDSTNIPGRLRVPASGFGWLEFVHADDKERSMAQWMHCVAVRGNLRIRIPDARGGWTVPLVPGSGRAHPRSRRKDLQMVRNLLATSMTANAGAVDARQRDRIGEDGG